MSEWISVKERLPEAYADGSVDAVLVTNGEFIHMAYFNQGKWHFCESGEMKEEMFYSVTHWMPLPKLPKPCDTCENNGYNMPQCGECNEQNEYKWYREDRA